jgi:hypothetical protein
VCRIVCLRCNSRQSCCCGQIWASRRRRP